MQKPIYRPSPCKRLFGDPSATLRRWRSTHTLYSMYAQVGVGFGEGRKRKGLSAGKRGDRRELE
jgi:hypothetical protein